MRSATLRKIVMVPMVLLALMAAVSTAPAAQTFLFCHGTNWPSCRGILSAAGTDISFSMAGTPALAEVDEFTDPATTRNVLWKDIDMKGTTEKGDTISATLDPARQSSGTVLSVGNTEFPATATMRFFFRMEFAGMTLVSEQPAVFQGIIHSIPPAPGDVLTLISPAEFHREGETEAIGVLKESAVSFTAPTPAEGR